MGYNLHITRKGHWSDPEQQNDISIEEWLNYANNDPELKNDVQNGPGFFLWIAHPEANGDTLAWFDYWRGDISTKNPDEATIDKMVSIANTFNAKVQGDDGELYGEKKYADIITPRDIYEIKKKPNTKEKLKAKPWWKLW